MLQYLYAGNFVFLNPVCCFRLHFLIMSYDLRHTTYDYFSGKTIKISIIILGITSLVTQIIMLREFMNVFYGNELIMGIVLANWMLINGIGAYLGKYLKFRPQSTVDRPPFLLIILQLFISFIPLLTVFSLYSLRNNIFPVGTMISLSSTFISSFLLLIPFCLISGIMFTLFCQILSDSNNPIPRVYSLDVIGSILGGLIFNLVLIFYLNTFQILTILTFLNLIASFLLSASSKKKALAYLSCVLILISFICIYKYDFEQIAKERLFKGQKVVVQKDTPYGNIVVTNTEEQLNYFENGVFLFSSENLVQKEEDVHYAMLQHKSPKQVLLISGGLSGTIDEILKYNIDKIDYLEINPWIIQVSGFKFKVQSSKVNIINKDPVLFLKSSSNSLPNPASSFQPPASKYDVALINVPPPSTAQLNRFYTIEFFTSLKRHLNEGAVISISLMSTADYVTKEAGELNYVLYNTLKTVFKNVLIVPGEKNYFIASDNPLSINIAELYINLKTRNPKLETNYVNQYYIDDELLKQRSDFILNSISNLNLSAINHQLSANTDFSPVAYYLQLQYWLSHFSKTPSALIHKLLIWFLVFCVLCLLFCLFYYSRLKSYDLRLTTIYISLFTTGFIASSLQFLLLIYFQVMYGYVYQMTGILITLFMFGLAAGVYLSRYEVIPVSIKGYTGLIFGLAIYTVAIPFLLLFLKLHNVNSTIIQIIFFFITIDIGTISGMIFTYAVNLQKDSVSSIAAKSYSSDLIGSAFGVLLASAFLLPLLGLVKVSIFIGMLNILSGIILLIHTSKVKSQN
jgi:spermidine synthase